MSQKQAAKALGITPRRFRQINEIYRSTGYIPAIGVDLGRPRKEIPKEWNLFSQKPINLYSVKSGEA